MRVGVIAVIAALVLTAGILVFVAADYEGSCAVVEGSQTIVTDQAERCGVNPNP
ncbi:MAG TPA: hypothetical protein VKD21_02255 [Acidimicrobiales bacterium]|nr:hypothetical protein [Acidimicrobiales bacterium]